MRRSGERCPKSGRRWVVLGALALSANLPGTAGAGASPGTIDTFAGGGIGDGRPGADTHLWTLASLSADAAGRVYWVEDRYANTNTLRVRMWDPETDRVRTVAGTGMPPYPWSTRTGDGLPATSVSIGPGAVAAAGDGDFYFTHHQADRGAIHRVDRETGILRQVRLNPFMAKSIETDAQGRLYYGMGASLWRHDPATGQVQRIAGADQNEVYNNGYYFSVDGQPANGTQIGQVNDIEVDATGNVYFSEPLRIRWIDTNGILHTLAGRAGHLETGASADDGQYGFLIRVPSGDHRLLLRPDGSIWYTEASRVRRIAPQPEIPQIPGSRRVTTAFSIDGGLADGPLASASFGSVVDLHEYPGGGFLVADAKNLRVRLVSAAGEVRTVVGNGRSTTYKDPGPDVYDWTGDGGPATEAQVSAPCGVDVGPDGDVYLTETEFHEKVRRVDAETGVITTVAGGDDPGFAGDGGPATEALFNNPCGVAVAADGDVFIADSANRVVRRVEADTGIVTAFAGTGAKGSSGDGGPATAATLDTPVGLALGPDGAVYISDPPAHRVRKVTPNGIVSTFAGTGVQGYDGDGVPAASTRLNQPRGLAFQPDGSLVLADSANQLIRRIDPNGIIHRVAGTGEEGGATDAPAGEATFDYPNGVEVDPATGTIFVADTLNQVVRRIDPDGMVRVVAGNGELDLCGDGGPAREACLRNPQDLAIAGDDLLFADLSNYRVRVVFGAA